MSARIRLALVGLAAAATAAIVGGNGWGPF
jgi:hypothetical protein